MARTDTPQFMLRIHATTCNCFANCWPCENHEFCANRAGRIVISCECIPSITQICGSNISFVNRQSYWPRFNGRFTVYRLITARCNSVLQLETCRTFGGIETVGRRWVLECGCLVSLICCEDPRPDGTLVYQDSFEEMNIAFAGLGGMMGEAPSEGMNGSAAGYSGRNLQSSSRYLPLTMGRNGNNASQGSSGQRVRGGAVSGLGQSADQPIELGSEDEDTEDALQIINGNH